MKKAKITAMEKSSTQILLKHFALFMILLLTASVGLAQRTTFPPIGRVSENWTIYTSHPYKYDLSLFKNKKKHDFTIVLKNDSTIEGRCQIDANSKEHVLKCKINGSEIAILPSETKSISHDDNEEKTMVGKPMDSCWAFLISRGKIRTYSITAEPDKPVIGYIQKGDFSTIIALTQENLEQMVSDNEKALDSAKKGKLLRAINIYNKEKDSDE